MDWNGPPEGGNLSVGVWHDVVEENIKGASAELPGNDSGDKPGDVITVWQSTDLSRKPEIVSFSQNNIVAATGALISAIPLRQRLSSADLVLPADGFAHSYVLCQTLAALFMHASSQGPCGSQQQVSPCMHHKGQARLSVPTRDGESEWMSMSAGEEQQALCSSGRQGLHGLRGCQECRVRGRQDRSAGAQPGQWPRGHQAPLGNLAQCKCQDCGMMDSQGWIALVDSRMPEQPRPMCHQQLG